MEHLNKTIGLSIFRVILSFIVIQKIVFYLPMADILFGAEGIVPYEVYLTSLKIYNLEFLNYPFLAPHAPQLFLLVSLVLAVMFLFSIYPFFSGVLLFFAINILRFRNGFILDGSDNVIEVTLPLLILAGSFQYFTYNQSWQFNFFKRSQFLSDIKMHVQNLSIIGLMIQICYVYFFTALAKLQGEMWLNGTATYYTMRVEEFRATDWNILLTENHYFVVLSTYFTILFEIGFAFLIWFRQTKFYIIIAGILLHMGIFIFMRIDNFSWIMIGSYALFITDKEYKAIFSLVKGSFSSVNLKPVKLWKQ